MQFVQGPDFPTGGQILGKEGIIQAYTSGRGSVKVRAKAEIIEGEKITTIVVTEIPYQTSVEAIEEKTADLVDKKEIEGNLDDIYRKWFLGRFPSTDIECCFVARWMYFIC